MPTGKVARVSPEAILARSAQHWECMVARAALIMEADGLITIENGSLKLTAKGRHAAIDVAILGKLKEGQSAAKAAAPDEGETEIEVSDEVYEFLLARRRPGESLGDVIKRLMPEGE